MTHGLAQSPLRRSLVALRRQGHHRIYDLDHVDWTGVPTTGLNSKDYLGSPGVRVRTIEGEPGRGKPVAYMYTLQRTETLFTESVLCSENAKRQHNSMVEHSVDYEAAFEFHSERYGFESHRF